MSSGIKSRAMSGGSLPTGMDVDRPGTTRRDVAAAAGVSVATVWNVLNSPQLVAPGTRARVEQAINELGFQPVLRARKQRDPHGPGTRSYRSNLDQNCASFHPGGAAKERTMRSSEQTAQLGGVEVRPGERVTVHMGSEIFSGVVDAVMPDYSYFWIWSDNGMGRRLVEAAAVSTDNGAT